MRDSDLFLLEQLVYKPMGLAVENLTREKESAEYNAATFRLKNRLVKFRSAKITPTKTGQFVTFWKRVEKGPILPYSDDDPFDLLIVSVRSEERFGQFIFPKEVLRSRGIVSTPEKEGKRATRVYPPWDKAESPQARKTRDWQLEWFVEVSVGKNIDFTRVESLLSR